MCRSPRFRMVMRLLLQEQALPWLRVVCFQQVSRCKAIVRRFLNGAFDVTEAQPTPSAMEV